MNQEEFVKMLVEDIDDWECISWERWYVQEIVADWWRDYTKWECRVYTAHRCLYTAVIRP